jgi:colanic acid biosynthesis glycosyl transferase WcaI
MKILFICAVFPPEPAPVAGMAADLARRLTEDGHRVTMLVPFPNRPTGKVYDGFHRSLRTIEDLDGVRVVRCPNWILGKNRLPLDRILENLTFGLSTALNALREGRPDVILLETWPLLAAEPAVRLGRWWKTPVIYYRQDLYPEAAEKLGIIREGARFARCLRAWDRSLCLRSAKVVVISENTRELVQRTRHLPEGDVRVIQNWIDGYSFVSQPRPNRWRDEVGISAERYVAMFAGTMGLVSGVGILVQTALNIVARKDITIVCVGDGVHKPDMIRQTEQKGLRNIRFEPTQPAARMPEIQGGANAFLLTVRDGYNDASVPSKLISYLATGRPVICAAPQDSTVAAVVREAQAGLVISPGDPGALAEAILYTADHPQEASTMGANARAYFEKEFTLTRAYGQFSRLIEEVTRNVPANTNWVPLAGAAGE